MNEIFYSIAEDGNIVGSIENDTAYDEKCYRLGNYFKTKEEAEFVRKKQLVLQELKDYAFEHNEEPVDWDNCYQLKHCLKYDWDKKKVYCGWDTNVQDMNQVYFASEKIAKNAIKDIGEDRIKKYLFEID